MTARDVIATRASCNAAADARTGCSGADVGSAGQRMAPALETSAAAATLIRAGPSDAQRAVCFSKCYFNIWSWECEALRELADIAARSTLLCFAGIFTLHGNRSAEIHKWN